MKRAEFSLVLKFLTPASSIRKVQGRVNGMMTLITCPESMLNLSYFQYFLRGLLLRRRERSQWTRKMKTTLARMTKNASNWLLYRSDVTLKCMPLMLVTI